ncbi:hypothetical protein AK812_SmicGene11622 [Symbiodinium microadriaticum]|uniref:Uncharacterized protein n=1 Tax=Symbiodinium microadriaticum TaxID=2951 RepID=A0A1Q9ECP8_SYMMI|nr:hypothetical protein AK812_SmicGene11622 [Symbiodinium microadriaticum]
MDELMDGKMGGWMDGWMDGMVEGCTQRGEVRVVLWSTPALPRTCSCKTCPSPRFKLCDSFGQSMPGSGDWARSSVTSVFWSRATRLDEGVEIGEIEASGGFWS